MKSHSRSIMRTHASVRHAGSTLGTAERSTILEKGTTR
jgi:hypothetical protein